MTFVHIDVMFLRDYSVTSPSFGHGTQSNVQRKFVFATTSSCRQKTDYDSFKLFDIMINIYRNNKILMAQNFSFGYLVII